LRLPGLSLPREAAEGKLCAGWCQTGLRRSGNSTHSTCVRSCGGLVRKQMGRVPAGWRPFRPRVGIRSICTWIRRIAASIGPGIRCGFVERVGRARR
jgi:hypothetical protein